MPEGDTIHQVAAALCPELCGHVVRHVHLKRLNGSNLLGRTISNVSSKGKHLFIDFDNGLVLRSHLGMYGAWHRYGLAERWLKPAWQASLVLQTDERVLVCFNAKEVEILAAHGYRLLDEHRRLGQDLIRDRPDAAVLARRAGELLGPDVPLADVLLDQRVAAGIGNVYKSEVLFLEGQSPLDRLADTPAKALQALYRRAEELLRRNSQGGPRVTRPVDDGRGRLWVYGRRDRPCLRCGTSIRWARLGVNQRVTYWCPRCQESSRGRR